MPPLAPRKRKAVAAARGRKKKERVAPDRISALPDEVLHLVLSLLPVHDAVATCVLARRWLHLWKEAPGLSVEWWDYDEPGDRFISLVDRFFTLRSSSAPLNYCSININFPEFLPEKEQLFVRWIQRALRCQARVLRISLIDWVELPNMTLISQHLTRLELQVSLELSYCPGRAPFLESMPSLLQAIVRFDEACEDKCQKSVSGGCDDDDDDYCFGCADEVVAGYGTNGMCLQGLSEATHLELSADPAVFWYKSFSGYSLMGYIKDIPTLKGDNYEEWKRELDLAFILGEVDWVLTTPCPIEPAEIFRGEKESDAEWQKRERDNASLIMSYDIEHAKWSSANKNCLAAVKNTIEPTILGSIPEYDTVSKYLESIKSQFSGSSKFYATQLIKQLVTERYHGGGVKDHILRMSNMASKLKQKDLGISDDFLVHLVLSSLPKNFDNLVVNYKISTENWNIEELISNCVQEEERHKETNGDSINLVKDNKEKSHRSPSSKEKQPQHLPQKQQFTVETRSVSTLQEKTFQERSS
ncbi:uncharacterized protein [Oryza sativa Japonica Group]|nr:retrotransposon protein, putative Ty1-copia subclass protein [Oryza sativa Japonica Group]